MITFIILYKLYYKILFLGAYPFLFKNTGVNIFLITLGCYKYYQVNECNLFVMLNIKLYNQRTIILSLDL